MSGPKQCSAVSRVIQPHPVNTKTDPVIYKHKTDCRNYFVINFLFHLNVNGHTASTSAFDAMPPSGEIMLGK